MPPQIPRAHVGIGVDPSLTLETAALDRACGFNPSPDRRAVFIAVLVGQIVVCHGRDLQMDIDPVEQGSGNPGAIALN
jgi:hypothetical protein